MASRVVQLRSEVASAGLDHHNGLYYFNLFTGLSVPPAPPAPIPPGFLPTPLSLHFVAVPINWVGLDDKSNPTVLVESHPIVSGDHAAKYSPHVPPGGNVLVPVTIAFASTTWKLAISSVIAPSGPVASTVSDAFGVTINCGDPISMPTGVYESPGSVHVAPSATDWGRAVLEWAATAVVEVVAAWGFGKGANWAKAAVMKKLSTEVAKSIAEKVAREAAEVTVRRNGQRFMKSFAEGAGDAATKQLAEEALEKEAKEAGEQAAKKAVEALGEEGADPVKAGAKGAGEAVEQWTEKQGHPGMLGTTSAEAAEQAKTHAKDNASKHVSDAVEERIKKATADLPMPIKHLPEQGEAAAGAQAGSEIGDAAKDVVSDDEATQKGDPDAESWMGDDS